METQSTPIWKDPRKFEINRLETSASVVRYPDRDTALSGAESDRYRSLNGTWDFLYLETIKNWSEDLLTAGGNEFNWEEIAVPGVWQLQGYGRPHYRNIGLPPGIDEKNPPGIDPDQNAVGCYRRKFQIPEDWEDGRVVLHFGGVKAAFQVWLNGVEVGYSQDSHLPAEFDISELLNQGENQLTVLVYRFCDGSFLEDQDMWYLNGIFRDVYLYCTPRIYLEDIFLRSQFDKNIQDAEFIAEIRVGNSSPGGGKYSLSLELLEPTGEILISSQEEIHLPASRGQLKVFQQLVGSPRKWSAETPELYQVLISLADEQGQILEVVPINFGFRTIEIRGRQLLLNGQPILIKGINRHEFDPRTGYYLTRESMEEQVKLLKRYHINAVRTAHYPNHPHFYDLCDRYGIYLMDEANLESHAFVSHLPRGREEWRQAVIARGTRMVRRDRNHPSILFWSLGNEAGQGENFGHLRQGMLELDSSRPIHYEGEYRYPHSDLVSLMYPSPAFLEKLAQGNQPLWFFKAEGPVGKPVCPRHFNTKPILVCEYAHAMGNSISRLDKFRHIFERYPNCAGGFIWDLIDQSLIKELEDGTREWTYGGDWGDIPNDGNFCLNGIFQPDMHPNPTAFEVQKVYQPVEVSLDDCDAGMVRIHNKHTFIQLDYLKITWTLSKNGLPAQSGELELPAIPPGEIELLPIPYTLPDRILEGEEYHLLIEFNLRESTNWAEKGFLVAWDQLDLDLGSGDQSPIPALPSPPTTPLIIHPRANLLEILILETRLSFDTESGFLTGFENEGLPLLIGPLRPNLYRVLDNDLLPNQLLPGLGSHWILNRRWENYRSEMELTNFEVERTAEGGVRIDTSHQLKQGLTPLHTSYQADILGGLTVQCSFKPRWEMLRFGFQGPLSGQLTNTTWYGRGPHETMPDRKTSGLIGVHRLPSDQIQHNYIHPQENGNRSDVRWVEFRTSNGDGLSVSYVDNQLLNFSLWPYTQADLIGAEHISELPDREFYTLNIDYAQRGVGDLFSMMYGRDPETKLQSRQSYRFGFRIAAVHNGVI